MQNKVDLTQFTSAMELFEALKTDHEALKDTVDLLEDGFQILKQETDGLMENAVRYKEFTYGSEDTRKTIQLDNYDSISGIGTDGQGYNLAMVSKWDVADFGSTGLHLNLNSKDAVTINDKDIVATTKDIENTKEEVEKDLVDAKEELVGKIDALEEKTEEEIKEIKSSLTAALHYKGSVETVEDLPETATIGDFYNILSTGANYAWDGQNWDKLSETIDLSPFITKEEAQEQLDTKRIKKNLKQKQQLQQDTFKLYY